MSDSHEFKVGQFGKIGEHMVGFELSKRGWIIFYPPYDERTDIVAIKFCCKKCTAPWHNEHKISCMNPKCKEFEKSIKSINSKKSFKNKKCSKCGLIEKRTDKNAQQSACKKCGGKLEEIALCPKCSEKIKIFEKNCSNPDCDSTEYELLFRSIQVKSSHLVEGNKIGFNFKYQDLVKDPRHFLIVYNRRIVNHLEKHFYWILSVADFLKIKKTDTVSFKIYQNDRGHYSQEQLEPYLFKEEEFYTLEEKKYKLLKENKRKEVRTVAREQFNKDAFRKLDMV